MSAPEGLTASRRSTRLVLPILLLTFFTVGCTPLVRGEQTDHSGQTSLAAGEALGQTFMPRYAGLSGIELYLEPGTSGDGQLLLRLWAGARAADELAQAELPLDEIGAPGFYRFPFPPQSGSTRQDYFASLELLGNGSVQAGIAPGEVYLNGALYRDQAPQDAQLAFRLVYNPWQAARGLFLEGLGWLGRLAAAGLLFVLPGWAVLNRSIPGWKGLAWWEKSGLAIGVSLSIYPILFLWSHLAGLQLGPFYAWGPPLMGVGLLVLPLIQSGTTAQINARGVLQPVRKRFTNVKLADLAVIAVLALIFAVRFWVIRSLDVPLWGDSYQHTMITQLLVEHGGLFDTWSPYAELRSFSYHFGFHTLAAVFHWMTRLPIPQSVLWTGQILNGLAVLALYPLAARFGRSRWAGVVTVLVAGLLVQMPMFYVNWGRYTELGGLAILPSVVYLLDRLISNRTRRAEPDERGAAPGRSHRERAPLMESSKPVRNPDRWLRFARSDLFKNFSLVWITFGGLALTHYRVLVFAVLFLPAALLFQLKPGNARLAILKASTAGVGAGLLFLPWFLRLFSGRILRVFGGLVTTPTTQVAESVSQYNAIGDLESYLPLAIWLVALVALAWGIWRRERGAFLVSLWWFFILLASNPQWLGLPGQGALSNFAVFIAAYLPASVLLGSAAGWALNPINRGSGQVAHNRTNGLEPAAGDNRLITGWLALLLCLALGLWGARERLRDVAVAQYALVTRADLRSMDWIRANTPQSSRFLVNSFLAYGDTLVAGSDAGWWLPLLAGRESTLPPINYSSEAGPRPDYLEWTNELTVAIQERGLEDPKVLDLLKARGVTHVYIGQQAGRVGNPGQPLLQAGFITESPHFRIAYHQDRVWIFEFLE